jgi:hypothetical protein
MIYERCLAYEATEKNSILNERVLITQFIGQKEKGLVEILIKCCSKFSENMPQWCKCMKPDNVMTLVQNAESYLEIDYSRIIAKISIPKQRKSEACTFTEPILVIGIEWKKQMRTQSFGHSELVETKKVRIERPYVMDGQSPNFWA